MERGLGHVEKGLGHTNRRSGHRTRLRSHRGSGHTERGSGHENFFPFSHSPTMGQFLAAEQELPGHTLDFSAPLGLRL